MGIGLMNGTSGSCDYICHVVVLNTLYSVNSTYMNGMFIAFIWSTVNTPAKHNLLYDLINSTMHYLHITMS